MDGDAFKREDLLAGQSLEQSFQMSVIDAHMGVCVVDTSGKIEYANDLFLSACGYERHELVGQPIRLLNSGYHARSFFRDLWSVIAKGQSWTGEVRNRRKDGSFYWDKSTIIPFVNELGEIERYVNIRTDITEIKEASERLQMSASFDRLDDEVYIFWAQDFRLIYLNAKAMTQIGWTADSVPNRTIFDVNAAFAVPHENFRESRLSILVEELRRGDREKIRYEFVGVGGRHFEAAMEIVRPENESERVVVVFRDISERVAAERAAQEHSATLDLIQNEVYVIDPVSLKFLYVNQAVARRLGWSQSELLNMGPLDLQPNFDEASYRNQIGPIADGKTSTCAYETVQIDRGGAIYPVRIGLERVDRPGQPPRLIAIVQDLTERMATEAEIRHLKTSLDLGQDEVYIFWADTLEYIYMNAAAKTRAGLGPGSIKGFSPADHMSETEIRRFMNRARPLLNGKASRIEFEVFDKHLDRVLAVALQLIKPDGRRARFLAIYRDVTAQRRSQNEIQELKTSLDLMRAEIFIYRPDSLKFIYLNQAAMKRMEWTPEVYVTRTVRDISPQFDERRFRRHIAPLLDGHVTSLSYETKSVTGSDIEITEQLINPQGEEPRILAIVRDISEIKAAERQIRSFKTTLDMTRDPIFIFRPDDLKMTYLNYAAMAHAGWTDETYRDHSIDEISGRFSLEEFRRRTRPLVFGTQESLLYETEDVNGQPFETSLQLMEFEGTGAHFVAVCRDISERKMIETRKKEFISTVSHELRTPLTSIKGALNLVEAGGIEMPREKSAKLLQIANKNCDRLLLLINDILDIEKLDSGQVRFHMEDVELNDFLRDAVATNAPYGREFGITFGFESRRKRAVSVADPHRLVQVISNLLSNAAKFSPKGASVDVHLSKQGDWNVISVRDHGIGIPEHELDRVFERFTQVDSTDTRQKGGTGLGLSITKSIVEHMGGEIRMHSTLGQGTTVEVRLPDRTAQELEAS
jgi:two-component system sensor histidine kinase VicK